MGPYAASKAGVHRLTEALSAELKGKVTVNAVLPSTIDTPANRASMPKTDFAKWVTGKNWRTYPVSRQRRSQRGDRRAAAGQRRGNPHRSANFFSTALKRMLRLPASAVASASAPFRCRCRKIRCRLRSRRTPAARPCSACARD